MKRKFFKFTLIALIAMGGAFTSCSKKEGPQGPEGPQGEQGIQGVQGIPGKDGSVIISGTAAPKDTDGKVGDMFLDTKNNKLYGPKAAKKPVWGTPLDIKGDKGDKGDTGATGATGAQGDKGDDGSVIYSGQGDGAGVFGMFDPPTPKGHHKSGDYFIHTETGMLYILEQEITSLSPLIITKKWKEVISLKGPKGDKGNDGNANVVASNWKKLLWANWITDDPKHETYEYTVPNPILNAIGETISINNFMENKNGIILVYFKTWRDDTFIKQVPAPFNSGNKFDYAILKGGNNIIKFYNYSPSGNHDLINPHCYIRYVLIPPSKILDGRGVDLTKLSYEEVKELYGLED